MQIGIAGIGKMGAAIAARLIEQGFHVGAWNRTRAKAEALAPLGVVVHDTPAALAKASDLVLAAVSDAAAIAATYDGASGLLAGATPGKLYIEMSTVPPEVVRALAERVRAAGAVLVESPVSGSTGPAREGKLFALVGGDEADVARAQPVLAALCRRIEYVGPVGAAASVKLAINLPLLVYYQTLGEALALMKPLGLEPERAISILADTSGAPAMMKVRAPSIVKQLQGGSVVPTVDIANVCKDLRTMVDVTQARGGDAPIAKRALECYEQALASGLGALDCTRLTAFWVERAPIKSAQ